MKVRVTLNAVTNNKAMPVSEMAMWLAHYSDHAPTVKVKPYCVTVSACIDTPAQEMPSAIERVVDKLKSTFHTNELSCITVSWRTDV